MTQPTQHYTTLHDAVAGHYGQQQAETENEPPAWWTPEVEDQIARYVADPAYRDGMTQQQRGYLSSRREAAIALGLLNPISYVPGHGVGGEAA